MHINIGIAGCGAVARRHHLPVLTRDPRAEVVAICDPCPEQRETIRNRFHIAPREYADLEALLRDKGIEVVILCTPGYAHFEHARVVLRSGRHVLIEKPPVHSVAEADELLDLAARNGLKAGVVLNSRYKPPVVAVKQAIDAGRMGRVAKVTITHHANLVFSESEWLWDERRSKYLLYEFGIHHLDLMVHFCGPHRRVLHVNLRRQEAMDSTTEMQALIEFESGALGILDLTQDSTRHSSYFTDVQVFGTGRDARIRHFPPLLTFSSGQISPLEALGAEAGAFRRFAWTLASGKFRTIRNASHAALLDEYLEWMTAGGEYPLELGRVLPTIRLLEEIERWIPSYAAPELSYRR